MYLDNMPAEKKLVHVYNLNYDSIEQILKKNGIIY